MNKDGGKRKREIAFYKNFTQEKENFVYKGEGIKNQRKEKAISSKSLP